MSWMPDGVVQHLRAVADAPDLSGTKYQLVRPLARGGMGAVYVAYDAQLDRQVALKVLDLPDASNELEARMMREARIVARLEHPGIVPIHDVGALPDGRVFYSMKLVHGSRLDEYVKKGAALADMLRVFQKACQAVAFAHANGVIHRDLKPENIMVGAFGEVLVMDWGLAKILPLASSPSDGKNINGQTTADASTTPILHARFSDERSHETVHGTILGTPAYMAPEQARGEIENLDRRTDVYALGAILTYLLRSYSSADNDRNNLAQGRDLQKPLARLRKIPKALTAICAKAMSADKTTRYADALDLASDIERFLDGLSVSSYKENPFEIARRWLKQYRFMVLLVLAYMLVRITLFFLLRR
jgi:serine/threonine protein kinase